MLDSVDNIQNNQDNPDLNAAGGNQQFLREWDQYQEQWLASADYSKRKPILLPISVDIDQGVIARDRLKASTIARLQPMMQGINGSIDNAVDAYLDYFDSIDNARSFAESSTLPTPLDLQIKTRVFHVFYLPRKNWTFTNSIQFSVSNMNQADFGSAFKVMGTFDDGHGLIVLNKNWEPTGRNPITAKYNLHVSIAQVIDGQNMNTDIIIDPGVGSDGPRGGGTGD